MKTTIAKKLSKNPVFQDLFEKALACPVLNAAIVCPETAEAMAPALEAAEVKILRPVLIGSIKKMTSIALQLGHHISDYECIDLSEAEATPRAVAMARAGEIQALMKGSLSTHDFLAAIISKEQGLRTGKRITQIMVMDVPMYPKPFMITDGSFNVEPSVSDKKEIVQNAIDFAHIIGIRKPKVALLSSISEASLQVPSSMACAAVMEMVKQGEIKGGMVEGPLAFDIALSKKAAAIKKISSHVAGNPDIVVTPNLDSGNILFKSLEYLAGATSFGIGVGAQVPIIFTSRSASFKSRLGSCLLARLCGHKRKNKV